jgi:hypothetical protein
MKNKHTVRVTIALLSCATASILSFATIASAQVVEKLPNLTPFPAQQIQLINSGNTLVFSTTSWNNGTGRLELRAGETGSAGQNVYQRIYLSDGGYYDTLAGTFVWHPAHNHFHFQDYATYTLQPYNAPGGSSRSGSKTTFCVLDSTMVNTSLPGAPAGPVFTTCGAVVQGMSVGWGDTYGYQLVGQSLDFTGNPSGDYKLSITIDPKNRIREISDTDNVSCTLIRINRTNSTVTVLNPWGCEPNSGAGEVVYSIQPNRARRNSVVTVTVTGAGFTPGSRLSFEGGAQAPTASNIVVLNATTMRANVTTRSGPGNRVYDVRVGSYVLPGAFTVLK